MRAALEPIGYQIGDVLDAMQADSGSPLKELWVDGGATRNHWIMQFLADLLQCPMIHSLSPEVSALGGRIWLERYWAFGLTLPACNLWSDGANASISRPAQIGMTCTVRSRKR